MRRRNYLIVIATGSLSSIAGCNSQGGDTSETASPTSTPEPTENTPTPEPPSFSVDNISPNSAELGENFQVEYEIENAGGDGVWEAEYEVATTRGSEPDSEDITSTTISRFVPAGETRTWSSDTVWYEDPLTVYYRIGDEDWDTIEVPDGRAPIIKETNLVSEWESYGDAMEYEISEVDLGDPVNIASRYWYWLENQTLDIFVQTRIYDESDERIDISTDYSQQVTDYGGWGIWERYTSFDSSNWETGTYTAEVLIRDEQNDEVSNAGTVEFDVV